MKNNNNCAPERLDIPPLPLKSDSFPPLPLKSDSFPPLPLKSDSFPPLPLKAKKIEFPKEMDEDTKDLIQGLTKEFIPKAIEGWLKKQEADKLPGRNPAPKEWEDWLEEEI